MIALLKYGTGTPFKRLEKLQQWDLTEAAAQQFQPALEELVCQAAQGGVMHNDDTGMRIAPGTWAGR